MTAKKKEEQRIIDQYQSDRRQNEREIEDAERRECEQKEREESIAEFKWKVFFFLNDEREYQESGNDMRELDDLYEELSGRFRFAEQECEERYETIQAEKKRLYEREEACSEQYYQQMRSIKEED